MKDRYKLIIISSTTNTSRCTEYTYNLAFLREQARAMKESNSTLSFFIVNEVTKEQSLLLE